MADTKVTSLKLSDEQRKKIASDLGLEAKMTHVPQSINLVAVKSTAFAEHKPSAVHSLVIA